MKPLVVFGGAILVAGTAVAGLSTMDNPGSQVASFMAAITGEDTNRNVRRPVWPASKTPPGAIAGENTKIVMSKPVEVMPVKQPIKKSASDAKTRKLVAALSGTMPSNTMASSTMVQEPRKMAVSMEAVKTADLAKQKAADKLVETIKKKAEIAAMKPVIVEKPMVVAKKNISYEANKRTQPALVSVAPKVAAPAPAKPESAMKVKKPAKPAAQVALLTKKERTDLGKLVSEKKLPAIDVVIEFDYKSSKLSDKALPQLESIGKALTDGQLADATFVIAGHTDSVGGSKSNMGLSSQRAMAVLDFLKCRFKIADKRLLAVGYGEERLKNSGDSKAAENRRVEFITLVR